MTIDDNIINQKIQYDIYREAGKMSALPTDKIYKYISQVKKYYHLIKIE